MARYQVESRSHFRKINHFKCWELRVSIERKKNSHNQIKNQNRKEKMDAIEWKKYNKKEHKFTEGEKGIGRERGRLRLRNERKKKNRKSFINKTKK